jgi:cytosine/adenosine deaminase-related metal-dependent hydrolase
LLIKNISLLYGRDLAYKESCNIAIKGNRFIINYEDDNDIKDCEGLLMIPAFINAHTHIGDSIAKDLALDKGFDRSINPINSIKKSILENSIDKHLISFMRNSILSMLRRGITTFVDFREGGLVGMELLRKANLHMRAIILGRVSYYQNIIDIKEDRDLPDNIKEEALKVIESANGLGISGANEYSNKALQFFNSIKGDKLLAIHAAESKEVYNRSMSLLGVSDINRIVTYLKPDVFIHMTNAKEEDLRLVHNSNIVICPRANAILGVGIPDIKSMLRYNCKLAIGTDNVMLNSSDLFREMDYIFNVCRALGYNISAKELLKMVTVNPAEIFKLDLGYIEHNMLADAIFIDKYSIDLEPIYDPYTAIVHRVDSNSIKAVMMNGKVVYGEL